MNMSNNNDELYKMKKHLREMEDDILEFKKILFDKIDEIQDDMESLSVKEKKTKRIRKIDINNSKFINKEGYAMLLSKVNWDDYQEMYRRVENLANICFAGHSSIYEISEAYALIKPLLDTIKERTDLIYELDEQIDDEDDF